MSELDDVRLALCGAEPKNRRETRADKTKAQALSPPRLLWRIATMPVVALGTAVTLYTATSPFDREDSVRHLIAMGGCEAAERVGLKHMVDGTPGYHAKFDTDGNGIVCEDPLRTFLAAEMPLADTLAAFQAKFVRP